MNCPSCGHANKDNAKFCVKCRHQIKKYNFDPYIIALGVLITLLLIFILISSHRARSISTLEIKSQGYLSKNNSLIKDYNSCITEYNKLNSDANEILTVCDQLQVAANTCLSSLTSYNKLVVDLNSALNSVNCSYKKLDVNFSNLVRYDDIYLLVDSSNCGNTGLYETNNLSFSNINNNSYLIMKNSDKLGLKLNNSLDKYGIYLKLYFADIDINNSGIILSFGNEDNYFNLFRDENKFYFKQEYGNSIQSYDINYNQEYNLYVGVITTQPILYIKDLDTNQIDGMLLDEMAGTSRLETQNLYYLNSIFKNNSAVTDQDRLFEINSIKVYNDYNESYGYEDLR